MTTYPHGVQAHRPHVNPWLVAVVGLAAALIGLGSWVIVDRYAGGASPTENATTLLDKTLAAWNTGDTRTIATLYTSDAVFSWGGDSYTGPAAIGQAAAALYGGGASRFHVERVSPVTLDGDYAVTWGRVTSLGVDNIPVLQVFQLKNGKILRQWGFAVGSEPFANPVTP